MARRGVVLLFGASVTKEIWKEIPESNGIYFASNLGRIKRIAYKHTKLRKNSKTEFFTRSLNEKLLGGFKLSAKGYLRINLNKKVKFVHQIIMLTFVGPANDLQVNHKDGNKLNNALDNLEYVTNNQNRQHAVNNRLHYHKIHKQDYYIVFNCYLLGESVDDLARFYRVKPITIKRIITYEKTRIK